MGYHKTKIERGVLGQLSKIREELDEAADAQAQGNRILVLCELADLYGAINAVLDTQYPGTTMADLAKMAAATASAFADGSRTESACGIAVDAISHLLSDKEPNQEFAQALASMTATQLLQLLSQSLRTNPLEVGQSHPAELIMDRILNRSLRQEEIAILSLTPDDVCSQVIDLIARFRRPEGVEFVPVLQFVLGGLRSDRSDVRLSAVKCMESWNMTDHPALIAAMEAETNAHIRGYLYAITGAAALSSFPG